ncbi:Lpp/OprI family alanine-zipper lipoprotein [Lacimicrobium sp. SS2-24]|uniref:Lpp/OprI family alanine-zipper lipoprotein n=1 Tax=Lacimicrobium sp. SS2-24 TaxID=2005569 RepID=UPI000B4BE841|nr:Lpp/OprI family alanine-zipper lipoprotein [Lacimicrobium sp. SS2-24]
MKKHLITMISLAAVMSLGGCASNNSDALQAQVDQLQSEMNRLKSKVSENGTAVKAAQRQADMATSEAKKAQQMASDNDERAKRMFERCCNK